LVTALPTQEEEDECPSPDFFIRERKALRAINQPILFQSPSAVREDDTEGKNEKRSESSTDKQEVSPDVVMGSVAESSSEQMEKQMAHEHL